jgi:hypothetical protein
MANECIPFYEAGQEITAICRAAAIKGCQFVCLDPASTWTPVGLKGTTTPLPTDVSGGDPNACDIVQAAIGAKRALGVAGKDQAANNAVMVITGPGVVVLVVVGAAVVPGNEVEIDATGRVVPVATGRPVGLVLSKQATVGQTAAVKLY